MSALAYAPRSSAEAVQCTYCGLPADTMDHVIPRSFRPTAEALGGWKVLFPGVPDVVPACNECNRLASDKVFESLEEKRDFIQGRLAHRYRRVLGMPVWSAEELAELRGFLRKALEADQALAEQVRLRLDWDGVEA